MGTIRMGVFVRPEIEPPVTAELSQVANADASWAGAPATRAKLPSAENVRSVAEVPTENEVRPSTVEWTYIFPASVRMKTFMASGENAAAVGFSVALARTRSTTEPEVPALKI